MLKIINRFVLIVLCFCFALIVNANDQKNSHNIFDNSNLVQWQLILIDYLSGSSPDFEHRRALYKKFK